jgi:PAS domain-containing protein
MCTIRVQRRGHEGHWASEHRVESVESLLKSALWAAQGPSEAVTDALNAIPAAVYLTDSLGIVTHYNRECVAISGRTPQPGRDRWCVMWKLLDADGEALPYHGSPTAVALRQGREIRGVEAIAERPDGTLVRFIPFPALLRDADGRVSGAVNLMIDVTDTHRAENLREQAQRCRRLSSSALDRQTLDALNAMATEYEAEAEKLARVH